MKIHNEAKVIDLNGERRDGESRPVELTVQAVGMIEEARREAAHARAREEATHRLMQREINERETRRARDRRTIQKLVAIGFLLAITVFGQILYIRSLVSRLGDSGTAPNRALPALFSPAPHGSPAMPQAPLKSDPSILV